MPINLDDTAYSSRYGLIGLQSTITADFQIILAMSRRNNLKAGLTGAILSANNCFAQILAGARAAVERCFERNQFGSRCHLDVTVLDFAMLLERKFTEWSMAFVGDPSAAVPDRLVIALFKDIFARNHENSGATVLWIMRQFVHQEDPRVIA